MLLLTAVPIALVVLIFYFKVRTRKRERKPDIVYLTSARNYDGKDFDSGAYDMDVVDRWRFHQPAFSYGYLIPNGVKFEKSSPDYPNDFKMPSTDDEVVD